MSFPPLRVPCVTLRNETEWVETVETGWNCLAGTDPDRIVAVVRDFLNGEIPDAGNPLGDGHAADKIVSALASEETEWQR